MSVYIKAIHSPIRVESLRSACVKIVKFAGISFIFFVPLCDCRCAAPIPKFEASQLALNG